MAWANAIENKIRPGGMQPRTGDGTAPLGDVLEADPWSASHVVVAGGE